jgi:serine/threonine protein kinase
MTLPIGRLLQNRYRIVKMLAQGGMGAVYRAWDMTLNRPCAVKENLDTSAEAQRQFQREATMLANLSHPNLPGVTDYFFLPGQGQYLVMDFVEGENLDEMLSRRGRIPESEALAWIEQVCEALEYLHGQNVVHRDIKPANVKITPAGQAMLVDFGISRVYDPLLSTTTGARAVTPGYSPWEQYGQGRTDARSDVYALGATLYTLLTGQVPPESVDLMGGAETLTPPHRLNPAISANTEHAILRAMEQQPSQRFQNAVEMKRALKAALRPASAHSPLVPTQSPVQRSDTRRGWLLIVALAGMVVIVWAVWLALVLGPDLWGTPTPIVIAASSTSTTISYPTRTSTAITTPTPASTVAMAVTQTAVAAGAMATALVQASATVGASIPTATDTPIPTPTPTPRPPTPTPVPPTFIPEMPTPLPTATSEPSSAGLGKYQTKYFALSIRGPTMREKALLGQHVQEEAEGIYLIVPVRWRNTSLIPRYNFIHKPWTCIIVPTSFSGCESYDVFATSAYYDTQGQYFSQERKLAPGETVEGWLVFDIPEDLTSPVLRIYFDSLGSQVVAEVPLE